MVFTYRDAAGEVLGHICRFEEPGGGKVYQPLTYCRESDKGRCEWRWKGWLEPRPLYGLDRLAARPDAVVIVTEGEKAADAATKLLPDHVAVTSPNGSKSAGKAQWGALARRHVVIWPDADEPGADYAKTVARCLKAVSAASVAIITPPSGVAEGWDAADALAEGWSPAKALALVQSARPADDPTPKRDDAAPRTPRPRDSLMDLVEGAELWHTPDREAFASVPVNTHVEHWPIKGEAFRDWLSGAFFARHQRSPSDQNLCEAVGTMAARALHAGPEHPIFLRVGAIGGELFLDLADPKWRAVRIHAGGWGVLDRPPVKFRRPNAMRPLPLPSPGGRIEDIDHGLRDLINFGSEDQFKLLVAWVTVSERSARAGTPPG